MARPAYGRDEIADALSAFMCVRGKPVSTRQTVIHADSMQRDKSEAQRLLCSAVQGEAF
jgi:hypothetical protein